MTTTNTSPAQHLASTIHAARKTEMAYQLQKAHEVELGYWRSGIAMNSVLIKLAGWTTDDNCATVYDANGRLVARGGYHLGDDVLYVDTVANRLAAKAA